MQRFYFSGLEQVNESVTIQNKEFITQLTKVLRVEKWDELVFFNWVDNLDFVFKIVTIDKKDIYMEKISEIENNSEIDFDLNIFQALPNKVDKIEYIIQKWVEIGVTGFYFFRSERSKKLVLSENKIERLNKILQEAVEQSGRSRLPEMIIEDDISLKDIEWMENIIFHTSDNESNSLKELKLDYSKWVNLFVWPEWGFSEKEISEFEKSGFKKVFLGDRILRTETTGIVAGFYLIQNK